MQYFPNGSQFAISEALGVAVPITALTNADPAVATAAGITADQFVGIFASWGGINNRASRAGEVTAGAFPLIGIDTSDTLKNPQDTFAGDLRVASNFVALTQVTNLEKSGGEQQFFQWVYLDDPSGQQFQRPTRKSARTMTLNMDYDPDLPWYQSLIKLDQDQRAVILRVTLPTGDILLYLGYVSFQEDPTMEVDTNMQNIATFSPVGRVTRIPAPVTP